MKTEAIFKVPGVPPNWANERMHHHELAKAYADWKWLANRLAHGARNLAGWPRPERVDPPACRWVEFTQYRYTLLDDDGAWNSMKPLIDGLKGALVVDDSPTWCQVIARPAHPLGQVQIPPPTGPKSERARVVIRVRLMQPEQSDARGAEAQSGQRLSESHAGSAAQAPAPASEKSEGMTWK